jgi:hypothetical protein
VPPDFMAPEVFDAPLSTAPDVFDSPLTTAPPRAVPHTLVS